MFIMGSTMSVGQGIMQHKAQRRAARASRRSFEQNSQRALEAYFRQTKQARERQRQEEESLSNEVNQIFKEGRSKMSSLVTSSLESGVSGQTLELLVDDIHRQELEYQTNSTKSFQYYSENMDDQLEEARLGTRDRIDDMRSRVTPRPSFLATALQIGSGVVNAYASSGLAQEDALTSALEAGQSASS
tara:strand:- start:1063 stop:1626 length:564 start_codon:yes stop_codon:yes gene_type:complete